MTVDSVSELRVIGAVSREHWTMPVLGVRPEANGTIELSAQADGTAILRLIHGPTAGGDQRVAVLDVTTAAQLSVGIWEAAGLAQQLAGRLGALRPPPPGQSSKAGQPASSLVSASPHRGVAPRVDGLGAAVGDWSR